MHMSGGLRICSRCAAIQSAKEASKDLTGKEAEKEIKVLTASKRRRLSPYLKILFFSTLLLGGCLAGVWIYFAAEIRLSKHPVYVNHPLVKAINLDKAIQDYSFDHGGMFPENLNSLVEKYITVEELPGADAESINYKRQSPFSYELTLTDGKEKIIFTEKGIR